MAKDPRIPSILKLIKRFTDLDFEARVEAVDTGDETDELIFALNELGKKLSVRKSTFEEHKGKINEMLSVMLNYTALDFSKKIPVSPRGDELDALAAGLNTLAEELQHALEDEKRTIKKLRDSESRYRQLVGAAPDAIVIINDQGYIIGWNRQAEVMFGWEEIDVLGRLLADTIIPERFRERHTKGLEHFLKTGEGPVLNKAIEIAALRKDNSEMPVELKISASKLNENYFFIGFIRDISERKKIELAQKESDARFRLLVENVKDYAIITLDPKGTIVGWNKGAEQIKGYTAQEILGKHISVFYTEEDREKEIPATNMLRAQQMGRYESIGWRVKKDGSRFWADVIYTALYDEKGVLTGFIKITRDITAQMEAQEKIIQLNNSLKQSKTDLEAKVRQRTSSLERSNMELREYAHVIAHDLKAPLRAVGTLADLVISDYTPLLDEEGRQKLQLIKNRVLRLDKMVSGILEYAEAGNERESAGLVDLDHLVAGVIRDIAPPKRINVIVINKLPQLRYNKKSLRQIFYHLISNAIKYNDKSEGLVEIVCQEENDQWAFTVSDNGPGIPAEFREKIFTIFQTLNPRDQLEGTGIGLAIVKKIIESNNGKIWVDSSESHGAAFHFALPKN